MRRSTAILVLAAFSAFAAAAFDWPADGGAYRYGFGSWRGGFLRGAEFGAADGLVTAPAEGDLVFAASGRRLANGFPVPGGSVMALAHSGGIMTVYSGFRGGSMSTYLKSVRAGDVLGRSAAADGGRGLTLHVIDAEKRRFVNPLVVMSDVADAKPPTFGGVSLRAGSREILLGSGQDVDQGSWEVLVDVSDPSPAGAPFGERSAPYEFRLVLDGSEKASAVFDAAWAESGRPLLFTAGAVDERAFFDADGRIRLGPFSLARGKVVMALTAVDFEGNRRDVSFSIPVR